MSLHGVALSLLTYLATWHLTAGYEPERRRWSAHPSLVPCQNFRTADGWIVVMCAKDVFWHRLCRAIGLEALASSPEFSDSRARLRHRDALLARLEERFAEEPSEHWLGVLRDARVPCAPVNTVTQALADAGRAEDWGRSLLVDVEHPRFGVVRQVGSPAGIHDAPSGHRRAPRPHEDAEDVLTGLLRYSPEQVRDAAARGAFG